MFEDFTTIDFILSYPGMIIVVVMLTQFTKSMWDKMKPNNTRYVVLAYSILFCILAAILHGEFTTPMLIVQTILVWGVNAIIIWFASMKSFETIAEPPSQTVGINVNNMDDEGVYKEAFDMGLKLLNDAKVVKMKATK